MNLKLKTLVLLATVGAVSLTAPGTLHAQEVLQKVVISATTLEQNTNTISNGRSTTTEVPPRIAITSASLIKQLILDEYLETNIISPVVPAGVTLDFNGTGFEIALGTNELVDVSDIMTWTRVGQNDITNGTYLNANGPGQAPYNSTDSYLVTVAFDDSRATGALKFTVTGLATIVHKASTPKAKTGDYTLSYSTTLGNGTGEGSITATTGPWIGVTHPIVLTGFTISASGSAIATK